MKVTHLEFSWEESRQPAKYEEVRAKLTVSVQVEDGDDVQKVSAAIIQRTKEKVKAALAADLKAQVVM